MSHLIGPTDRWSEVDLQQRIAAIRPVDTRVRDEALQRWRYLCKPLHSLGHLEKIVTRICSIHGELFPDLDRRAVFVFCADNGIVAEGVTQTGQEVTAQVARNMIRGLTTVSAFSRQTGCDVFPVNVGMAITEEIPGVLSAAVSKTGTKNFLHEPAMTRPELIEAIQVGWLMAEKAKREHYGLLIAGEMGIGNTTTSSALLSALLRVPPERVTGRGAGLSDEGLARKIAVIREALSSSRLQTDETLECMRQVGGFDIAAMCGFYLGCAALRLPVLLDGLISLTAAVAAQTLHQDVASYLFASHYPAEPGGKLALRALDLQPVYDMNLAVGEGTGGVAMLSAIDLAFAAFRDLPTFEEGSVEEYQPLS